MVTSKCSQMTHAVERNRERMVDVEKSMDNRWLLEYPADMIVSDTLCIHPLELKTALEVLITYYERPE